jgi:hypothetical protein
VLELEITGLGTLVNTVVAACVVASGQTSMGGMGKALLDSLAGNASEEASKEQLQKEIHALKNEFANLLPLLDQSSVVKKRRSTFYDLLRNYQKVKSISVALTDETKKPITKEQLVAREEFKAFIISSNTVAPQVVENAEIEIISPVLMKGKHKWRGMYKGEPISFVMKSDLKPASFKADSISFFKRLIFDLIRLLVAALLTFGFALISTSSDTRSSKPYALERQVPPQNTSSKSGLLILLMATKTSVTR